MADDFRVFISAVTSEFGKARDALASDLRARGATVRVQSDFNQGGSAGTLLERLHDYIHGCDAVICVIGQRSGSSPPHVPAKWLAEMLPDGVTEASYTQWEYFFARHYGRKLYRYLATSDYQPEEAGPTPDALQAAFVQYIKNQGGQRAPFKDASELRIAVLREPWPNPQPDDPKPKPKPIVLPYPSLGALFKGREGFMQQLHESLSRSGQTAITSKALYGLGGIGKTRAAVEYAWAHRDDYTALLFVVAETPEALRRNLAALAATLLPGLDTTDDTARLRAVLDWLATNPGWFLIFDNLDKSEALAEADALLFRLSAGHVVITSRLANFTANFEPLALDVLTVDDAASFLLDRTKGRRRSATDDDTKAREVAVELDGLALALEQAGAYVAKHRLTFDGYLQRWRSAQHDDVLRWYDKTVTGYPRTIAVTWQTSVAQLTSSGRRLLERLAWLSPEKIPEFLLDYPIPGEADDLGEALDDLANYSLVTRSAYEPFFLIHRLVQDVTLRSLESSMRLTRMSEALQWVSAAFPKKANDVRDWPQAEVLAPHARAVLTGDAPAPFRALAARLMNDLAAFLESKALYAEAEPLHRDALAVRESVLGPTHPEVNISLSNLGTLLQTTNRLAEAEPLIRRALTISENTFGPDHPDVAVDLHNLAHLLHATNRFGEAETLMRRALTISENTFGPDHPNVALNLNNLASLLQNTNRSGEAEALLRRALTISENTFGPDHPSVALNLDNLAYLLLVTNRRSEAEPLMRRAFAISENAFGPDHPDVARSLGNLANLLLVTNRLGEAETLMRRVLIISEKTFGPDHPAVAVSLNNLASLLHATNRRAKAEPLMRRALITLHAFTHDTGHSHPSLEKVIKNFAALLEAKGRSKKQIKAELDLLAGGE